LPLDWLRTVQAKLKVEAGEVQVGLTPSLMGLSADLELGDAAFALPRITAKVAGGAVAGSARLEFSATPLLSVQGEAREVPITGPLFGGSLDLTAGTLSAGVNMAGEGHSPAALLATLTGTGSVQVQNGTATGFDLASAGAALGKADTRGLTEAARAALSQGTTPFAQLDSKLQAKKGVLSIEANAAAPAGSAALTGTLDMLGGALEGRLTLRPGTDLPELVTRLTGPALQPVRTPELAGLARWLAERP